MTEHEELIKRLRSLSDWEDNGEILHEAADALAAIPTPPVAGEPDARWDTAIDILLNGRWVDPEAKIAVFAYHDGEISKAELKRRLL